MTARLGIERKSGDRRRGARDEMMKRLNGQDASEVETEWLPGRPRRGVAWRGVEGAALSYQGSGGREGLARRGPDHRCFPLVTPVLVERCGLRAEPHQARTAHGNLKVTPRDLPDLPDSHLPAACTTLR